MTLNQKSQLRSLCQLQNMQIDLIDLTADKFLLLFFHPAPEKRYLNFGIVESFNWLAQEN